MNSTVVIGDWGSTRLRLWRLEGGAVTGRREGPGIASGPDPAGALLDTLGDWPAEQAILSGMAGSREGLCEAPYVPCPAGPAVWKERTAQFRVGHLGITIAPGFCSRDDQGRPDVMRGEETQVFGALALDPGLASGKHLFVLPGTHSKWVTVEDGSIASFRTFISGELFGLLKRSSLFAASSAGEADMEDGFSDALTRSGEPCELSSLLFEARSARLQDGRSDGWASGFVSGLLVGAELKEMAPEGAVTIIGEAKLAARYAIALARSGVDATTLDGEDCAIAGLRLLDDD